MIAMIKSDTQVKLSESLVLSEFIDFMLVLVVFLF